MEPSQSDLPFLVVHGEWLWPVAIAALIAAVLGGIHLVRWRLARFHARVIAEGLDIGGDHNVRGRLGGPQAGTLASVLYAEPRRGLTHTSVWYVPGAWIETPEGRILLEGPIHVVAGSRAAATRNGAPRAVSGEELAVAAAHSSWIHRVRRPSWGAEVRVARYAAVAAGDEVVVAGEALERAPAAGPADADYREGRVVWKLRGTEHAPIRIAARAPRGATLRMSIPAIALLVAALGFGTYGLMREAGASWRDDCDDTIADPDELSSTHACALAAAMPGASARREALETLLRRLEEHPARDERSLRRILGLAEIVRGCGAVVERLLAHDRYEDAARAARACGDPAAERTALVLDGRFAEAAALALPGDGAYAQLSGAELYLAAGRWADAAEALEVRAGHLAADPAGSSSTEEWRDRKLVYTRCLAELVRHGGGDPRAAVRLQELRAGPHGDRCAAMTLELAAPGEQSGLLDEVIAANARKRGLDRPPGFVELAWSRGLLDLPDYGRLEQLVTAPEHWMQLVPRLWLIGADPAKLPAAAEPERRRQLLRWVAAAQALGGDAAGAERTMRELRAGLDAGEASTRYDLLDAAIGLYAGRRDLGLRGPRHYWMDRFSLRDGRPLASHSGMDGYGSALLEAQRGDGRALADELPAHPPRRQLVWADGDVLAVWPRIERGREEVARQLAWSAPPRHPGEPLLWSQVTRAAMRRAVLAAAGATAEAARWDAIYRRYAAMLSDRRRVVALILARP